MARLWQRVSDNTNTPTDPSGIRPGLELISPQQADGYQKTYENLSQAVTPECFIGGSVRVSSGFPIEAFGNDRL